MFLAQERMILMASMEVSGKAALQANSERQLMASWKEGMEERKWCLNIWSVCVSECVSVCVRERERVCVCVCVREKARKH